MRLHTSTPLRGPAEDKDNRVDGVQESPHAPESRQRESLSVPFRLFQVTFGQLWDSSIPERSVLNVRTTSTTCGKAHAHIRKRTSTHCTDGKRTIAHAWPARRHPGRSIRLAQSRTPAPGKTLPQATRLHTSTTHLHVRVPMLPVVSMCTVIHVLR